MFPFWGESNFSKRAHPETAYTASGKTLVDLSENLYFNRRNYRGLRNILYRHVSEYAVRQELFRAEIAMIFYKRHNTVDTSASRSHSK
jgi:hypothetical protein